MNSNDSDLGNFFQTKKKKGPRKKQQKDDAPEASKDNQVQQNDTKSAAQEEAKAPAQDKQNKKATKQVDSDEAAFMKQTDAYESSDEERAEINIDADSVIKDTKEVEKQKRLAEERETGNKMGWDVIAKGKDNNVTNSRADFGTKKPEPEPAKNTSSGPIQFKRGSGPPTFKKSNAFGNKTEFPTFEGGKGGKNNNEPLSKNDSSNVARSEQSSTGHFGLMASAAKSQDQPKEERKQATMPVFKGKAKIGGGAKLSENNEESKAHNYDTGFMARNVPTKKSDGERKPRQNDDSDNESSNRNQKNDSDDDFNTVTEKKREFKKGGGDGYPRQKKQFSDKMDGKVSSNKNFDRGVAKKQQTETIEEVKTDAAPAKKAATKPAQLPSGTPDWSNVFKDK